MMPMIYDALTLTPALSLRERENRSPTNATPRVGEKSEGLTATGCERLLFPLPAGEGQGEGECHEHKLALERQ